MKNLLKVFCTLMLVSSFFWFSNLKADSHNCYVTIDGTHHPDGGCILPAADCEGTYTVPCITIT